jgi:hypothetical protein
MTVKTNQLRQLSYLVRGFPGSSLRTRGELGESSSEKAPLLGSRDSLGEMFDKKKRGIWNYWTVFWICTVCWCFMCLDYGTKRVYLFGPTSVTLFWYHVIRLLVFIMLTDTSLRAMINLATNHEVFPLDRRLNQWTIDVFWSMWTGMEHTTLPRPMIWVKLSVNLNQLSLMELTWLWSG